jgi:hypothetical protein
VQTEGQAIQRIEEDEDDVHGGLSSTFRISDKLAPDGPPGTIEYL